MKDKKENEAINKVTKNKGTNVGSSDDSEEILFTSVTFGGGIPIDEFTMEDEEIPTKTPEQGKVETESGTDNQENKETPVKSPKIEANESKELDIQPPELPNHKTTNIPGTLEGSSLNLRTTLHEEILEFDLSDPIGEPVAVEGSIEDSDADDSIIHTFSSVQVEDMPSDDEIITEISGKVQLNLQPSQDIDINKEDPQVEVMKEEELPEPEPSESETDEVHVSSEEDDLLFEEDDLNVELGEQLHQLEKSADKINQVVIEEDGMTVEVDISREHITLINNSDEFMKHQHAIMDNRCISLFWPTNGASLAGSRISISTEKDKTFVIDLDKIDTSLLSVLVNSQRPIKVFHNAKPVISWCRVNNLNLNHIFDITTALGILCDGKNIDNSIAALISRYSDGKLESDEIGFQDFVFIGKFLLSFRKKLVECFQNLEIMDVLNLDHRVLFALAQSESNGMPYNEAAPNPMKQAIWDLVESKYGVTSKKELAKAGILFLYKPYLNARSDLLEVREYVTAEDSERIRQGFDASYVIDGRVRSVIGFGPASSVTASDYSFAGTGLYSFISPSTDSCLIEGSFKDLEVRVLAKLLNKAELLQSFLAGKGPYAYFAAPLFEKNIEEITLDEEFTARMILEMVVRDFGERETLNYAWNVYQTFMKEDEINQLKKKFKKVHPDLIKLVRETREQAQKNGYVTTSTGRISVVKNKNKAFYTVLEMYINDIFKRALDMLFHDLEMYNADYSRKIALCTIYNRIITLECEKNIVNLAIDMLTRNMTRAASKVLRGLPVLSKVHASEQWEC